MLLFLDHIPGHSQNTSTGIYELFWAISHPVSAIKVKRISKNCYKIYDETKTSEKLDAFISGGKTDAYRHVFYMAAFAQKIKVTKLRKLGKAHEKTNYRQFKKSKKEENELPDSLSSVMDLRNNELGFKIGSENKALSLEQLDVTVISAIKRGEAYIMKRNKKGEYLNCEGQSLFLETRPKKWKQDKCLVASDYNYID